MAGSTSILASLSPPQLITSVEDPRAYRLVWLPNRLPCLLVHDPSTDLGAAAMSVRAGHFQDPADLPGLAHFTEHMLFLGAWWLVRLPFRRFLV